MFALCALLSMTLIGAGLPDGGGLSVGDYAKDFKLKNVDGKMVSMADYPDAKGFIITFTCNTCPYSGYYETRIMDLHKKYASRGFPVIAINPNDIGQKPEDSMEHMKKRSAKMGYDFPYLRDDTQEVARSFGATRTPHMFVLSKAGGKYKVEFIGAIDDNPRDGDKASKKYVEDAVDAILAGKKVETTTAKAIGCTIKWGQS